VHAGEEMREKL